MSDPVPAQTAYDLLTRPTTSLTDAEVELIVRDLQQRRFAYVSSAGKKADKPAAKPPATPEDKAKNTAAAAAAMNLDLGFD